jgi:hypothetical protein
MISDRLVPLFGKSEFHQTLCRVRLSAFDLLRRDDAGRPVMGGLGVQIQVL